VAEQKTAQPPDVQKIVLSAITFSQIDFFGKKIFMSFQEEKKIPSKSLHSKKLLLRALRIFFLKKPSNNKSQI